MMLKNENIFFILLLAIISLGSCAPIKHSIVVEETAFNNKSENVFVADTINLNVDFKEYKKQAQHHFDKAYYITKTVKNSVLENDLLSKFYDKDSLKIVSIPYFHIDTLSTFKKSENFIKSIKFDQKAKTQNVYIENLKGAIVSEFFLIGEPILEEDYNVNSPTFDIYRFTLLYINSFNEFLVGGSGGYDFNVLSRDYKNFSSFKVIGFTGYFIIDNGVLYYVRAYQKSPMNSSNYDISLNDIKIPKSLVFKRVEFKEYINSCFCEDDVNKYIKKGRFEEGTKELNCLKKLKEPKSVGCFVKFEKN